VSGKAADEAAIEVGVADAGEVTAAPGAATLQTDIGTVPGEFRRNLCNRSRWRLTDKVGDRSAPARPMKAAETATYENS